MNIEYIRVFNIITVISQNLRKQNDQLLALQSHLFSKFKILFPKQRHFLTPAEAADNEIQKAQGINRLSKSCPHIPACPAGSPEYIGGRDWITYIYYGSTSFCTACLIGLGTLHGVGWCMEFVLQLH